MNDRLSYQQLFILFLLLQEKNQKKQVQGGAEQSTQRLLKLISLVTFLFRDKKVTSSLLRETIIYITITDIKSPAADAAGLVCITGENYSSLAKCLMVRTIWLV